MTASPDGLLNGLLRLPPDEVEAFVREGKAPEGFNWLGLAEVAGAEALPLEPGDVTSSLAWARVAALAHQRLAELGVRTPERAGEDVMRLRANLILRHGARSGDPFLDCDQIIDWFLDTYDSQFEQVRDQAMHWSELPISRIGELRQIAHGLAILRRLAQCERFGSPEVQRWLALWDSLP